jgi:hypothetical protein
VAGVEAGEPVDADLLLAAVGPLLAGCVDSLAFEPGGRNSSSEHSGWARTRADKASKAVAHSCAREGRQVSEKQHQGAVWWLLQAS